MSPKAAPNVFLILLCGLPVIQKWSLSMRFGAPSSFSLLVCRTPGGGGRGATPRASGRRRSSTTRIR
jgi:hypothetical protein